MRPDLNLREVIARLATLGEWETARGPQHPTDPDPTLAPEIDQFLARYPSLRRDPGYVAFLEQYAGARLSHAGDILTAELPDHAYRVEVEAVELFGFSHTVSYHLVDGDGEDELPIVDADGFLQVAALTVTLSKLDEATPGDDMVFESLAIAYDTTGVRPAGVYARTFGADGAPPVAQWSVAAYQRRWASFLDFLADLASGAVLHTPPLIPPPCQARERRQVIVSGGR